MDSEISTRYGNPSNLDIVRSLLSGQHHVDIGNYKNAIDCFRMGLEKSITLSNQLGIAYSSCLLGNDHLRLGEYEKAIEFYEKDLEISTAIGDQSRIATTNCYLGRAYLSLGEHKKAIEYCEIGLEISTAIGDQSGIASSNGGLGDFYASLGQYEKSIKYYEKSLEISTAIGDQSEIASSNGRLGNFYGSLGQYEKSIEYYEKSLEISTAIGDQIGIATNNANMGAVYRNLGQYQKAIEHHKKGLEISTAIGHLKGIASTNGNLGNVYGSLGQHEKSIKYYEKGLEISTAIGDQSGIATKNDNLGNAYFSLGQYQKAIEYYETGLEISTAIGDQSEIATIYCNLGTVSRCLGQYQRGIEYYIKGLQISTAIGDQSGIAFKKVNMGNAYQDLGQYRRAIEYYEQSLEISSDIGDQSLIAKIIANLGRAYLNLGEYEDASINLIKSIRLFDTIFIHMVPDQNKLDFIAQYFIAHELSMTCFLSLKRTDSALLVSDLGRAKELHFCIEKNKNSVDQEMVDYSQAIWNGIEAKNEQLQIEEIQKILDGRRNDTSILLFAFDQEGILHIWILNKECIYRKSDTCLETLRSLIIELLNRENVNVNRDSSFFKLDSIASNNNQLILPSAMPCQKYAAKTAVESTTNNSNLTNHEILQQLFFLLFYPVKKYVQGNKLIIVPDKHLFFAPFSSLVDENGCYLSHSYCTQITPSLHTLKSSMQRSYDSNIGFALFVGNPTVGKVCLNEEIFTPIDLPSATEEVKCLSKLFDTRPLLGPAAKKGAVLQLLSEASIIHIAAHGEPKRGEIMLAPNCSPPQLSLSITKPESYLLTQRDITNISLQARLVVLCCCHTGQGEISSEGVIGIARAFLAAGARSVVATLWPINDNATKEFMDFFYGEICKETSACEALRKTMDIFQKHEKEEYRSIKIWAPFTIYGEDVKFQKDEIEKIRERSREKFSSF